MPLRYALLLTILLPQENPGHYSEFDGGLDQGGVVLHLLVVAVVDVVLLDEVARVMDARGRNVARG